MRIILCTSKELESKELDSSFFDNDKFFITIKSNEEESWPISYADTKFILKLIINEFNLESAKTIHSFIDSINPKKTLYITCSSGVEQAGAIRNSN